MSQPNPNRLPHAWGYCRASTEKQQITNEAQEQQITKYFDYKLSTEGIAWGFCFKDEAETSRTPWSDRRQGRLLFEVVQPGDHILVAVHDRPFRSMKDAMNTIEHLIAYNIKVHFLNLNLDLSDPMGMAMFQVVMAFAQLERGMISKRTKEALAWKRGHGLPTGRRAPIGWRKVGAKREAMLVPDGKARARAYLIVELRESRCLAWEDIPEALQAQGILGETEHYRRKDASGKMSVQSVMNAYKAAKSGFPLANGERQTAFDWEPELWRAWGVADSGGETATLPAGMPT